MTIPDIIQKLKTGNRQEIKAAKKELERMCDPSPRREELFTPFLREMEDFDSIRDIRNRIAFITALRWPILALWDTHFDLLKDFTLKILQDDSGHLRQAMIHSATYLILSFRLLPLASEHLPEDNKRRAQKIRMRFCELAEEVQDLIGKYYEPRFSGHKYIDSLPASVYRSLQVFFSKLLGSEALEAIYLEYRYERDKQGPGKANMPGLALVQKQKEWDYYFDAMEYLNIGNTDMARMLLRKALKIDHDFVAGHVGMVAVAREEDDPGLEKEHTELAYDKTRKHYSEWPDKMLWGVIDNRPYLRAICDKAMLCHREENLKEAERLYRLLLKLNPTDNQGVRYLIAGMFAGISPEDVDALFDEGNRLQNWSKLERLVLEQDAEHHFWEPPEIE